MPSWWGASPSARRQSAHEDDNIAASSRRSAYATSTSSSFSPRTTRRRSAYEDDDESIASSRLWGSAYEGDSWDPRSEQGASSSRRGRHVEFRRANGHLVSFEARRPAKTGRLLHVRQMKPAMRAMHACATATAGMPRAMRQGKEMRVRVPARYQRARPTDAKLYAQVAKRTRGVKSDMQIEYAVAFEREYGADARPYVGKTVVKRRHTGGAMRSCVKTLFASQEKAARYAITHDSGRRVTPSAMHGETIRRLRRAYE